MTYRINFRATFASWHYPFIHYQNDVCGLSLSYCRLQYVTVHLVLASCRLPIALTRLDMELDMINRAVLVEVN